MHVRRGEVFLLKREGGDSGKDLTGYHVTENSRYSNGREGCSLTYVAGYHALICIGRQFSSQPCSREARKDEVSLFTSYH